MELLKLNLLLNKLLCRFKGHLWKTEDPNWAIKKCIRCGDTAKLFQDLVTKDFHWKDQNWKDIKDA